MPDNETSEKKILEKTGVTEKFTKDKLLVSSRYLEKKDIVSALLEDDKEYTLSEVDELIEKFMKGKVE